MILVFLGSWRSTVIIAVSIPLSILTSIIVLSALGETINIMTLGGLALAVGILVDDATVEIENINSQPGAGQAARAGDPRRRATQIAVPAFVSTLCICIVFVPMFFLSGVARYLFVPLAEAVVFAMLASYVLSRTLVPTMAKYLLKPHRAAAHDAVAEAASSAGSSTGSTTRFQRLREATAARSSAASRVDGCFAGAVPAACVVSFVPAALGGTGFLPGGGQRAVQAPRARADRNADRADRVIVRAGRSR